MIEGQIALRGGRVLVPQARKTSNALERARGLLGQRELGKGEALVIEPCAMIHTVGMRYSLDVVFLDDDGTILKLRTALRPFRCAGARGATTTVELRSGGLEECGILEGMQLVWRPLTGPDPR